MKDVTVSKLSQLQKRILAYARRQMLAKGQKIEPPDGVTVCLPAPPWLNTALTKAMNRIFKVRKIGGGALHEGGSDKAYVHEWQWFFDEMVFLGDTIRDAAKVAGASLARDWRLTSLYEIAISGALLSLILVDEIKWKYHPWPYHDGRGWYFKIDIENKIADEIIDYVGEASWKESGGWLNSGPSIPKNCTVPEMLRDMFNFPVQRDGHISALAFSKEDIGEARYNSAQAAVRRACERLGRRGLIHIFRGQSSGFYWGIYERSSIGLTEAGVAVADALSQEANTKAEADLRLFLRIGKNTQIIRDA